MPETLIEIFSGTLAGGASRGEQFDARIEFAVPSSDFSDTAGVSAKILSGSVNWAFLGLPARITGGVIYFFRKRSGAVRTQSVEYEFHFSCEAGNYFFAGEKRFTGVRNEAYRDLSTVHASVAVGARRLAEGADIVRRRWQT
jgi:hypothetical protein